MKFIFYLLQIAGEVADAKTNPLRAKKMYVLAALLVSLETMILSKPNLVSYTTGHVGERKIALRDLIKQRCARVAI